MSSIGGAIGKFLRESSETVSGVYYLDTCKESSTTFDSTDGTSMTKDELKLQATFTDWDFTDTWVMDSVFGRPVLKNNREANGSKDCPYIISNLVELETFRDNVNNGKTYQNEYFKLTADIDLSEKYGEGKSNWTPIGKNRVYFKGTFDGNGFEIKNLYIESTDSYKGLFGYTYLATIKNLTVSGDVTGNTCVGGIIGYANSGTIENCCNKVNVNGKNEVGGIAGEAAGAKIKYSYNTGKVVGSENYIGGVAGIASSSAKINNCYNTGDVSATNTKSENIGGIIGRSLMVNPENCYNTGTVTAPNGTTNVGGVVGYQSVPDKLSTCYYLDTAKGENTTFDNTAGVAKTKDDFEKGAVANLLQGSQTETVWGQDLKTDKNPILTSDTAKRVYSVTYMQANGTTYATDYANASGVTSLPEETPNADKMTFSHWAIGTLNGEEFKVGTPISGDTKVYAVGREVTTSTGKSDKITGKKGAKLTNVNLSDYVENKSGNEEKNFTFTLADGSTLPKGLELINGVIKGIPTEAVKKDVTFNVSNNGIALMSLNDTGDKLTLSFDIDFGENGSEKNPYLISTLTELEYFASKVNGGEAYENEHIKLTANIDMSEKYGDGKLSWTPIGNNRDSFKGTFDGNGFEIENMYITGKASFIGLFGYTKSATIKNLTVTCDVTGRNYVGGIVGNAIESVIENCCNKVNANGVECVGGIAGRVSTTKIKTCYNVGNISGTNESIGGVAGMIESFATVINCYNTGEISTTNTGAVKIGGICGISMMIVPTNCYNTGKVIAPSGTTNVGGVVGYQSASDELSTCYYLDSAKGENTTFDNTAGVAKTKDDFEKGAVAYLLQEKQTEFVWGQDLNNDKSPMLTAVSETKRVRKITIDKSVSYLNDGDKVTEPKDPTNDGFTFICWLDKDGEEYDFNTLVSDDVTLVSKWKKNIVLRSGSEEHTYDGSAYDVRDLFGGVPTDDADIRPVYSITDGQENGTLDGYMLTIKKAGDITIKLSIADTDKYMGAAASTILAVEKGTHTDLTYPTASDIVYGDTLEKSTLSGGSTYGAFAWADKDEIPTCENIGYAVKFTPNDTDLYAYNSSDLEKTVEITVAPRSVKIEWDNTDGIVYDGNDHTITPRVCNKVYESDDITLTTSGTLTAVDKGEYTATVTAISGDNYTLGNDESLTKNWVIAADTNEFIDTISITGWTYNDTPNAPTATAKYGDIVFVYSDSEDGVYTRDVPTNAGTYYVKATVAGTANYSELVGEPMQFVIERLDIEYADITLGDSLTYNGSEQEQTVSEIKVGGLVLENADYTLSDNTQTNAGDYVLTVTGKGNYKGTATKPFSVAKKRIATVIDLTAPKKKAEPQMSIENDEYTATVVWTPEVNGKFSTSTVYTALITIECNANYTLDGIEENGYTVSGAKTVTNDANSGVVTVEFPKTSSSSSGGGSSANETVTYTVNLKQTAAVK